MKRILTLTIAATSLILASCASTKKEECTDCSTCCVPGQKSECCADDTKGKTKSGHEGHQH